MTPRQGAHQLQASPLRPAELRRSVRLLPEYWRLVTFSKAGAGVREMTADDCPHSARAGPTCLLVIRATLSAMMRGPELDGLYALPGCETCLHCIEKVHAMI